MRWIQSTAPIRRPRINQAVENVKAFDTGMNCEPWTYGACPLHIADYANWTAVPNASGQMVTKNGCMAISPDDPSAAAYYKVTGLKPSSS